MSNRLTFRQSVVGLCTMALAIKGAFATVKDVPEWWRNLRESYGFGRER